MHHLYLNIFINSSIRIVCRRLSFSWSSYITRNTKNKTQFAQQMSNSTLFKRNLPKMLVEIIHAIAIIALILLSAAFRRLRYKI